MKRFESSLMCTSRPDARNVNERAELGDVGDDAFEDHFWLNVGELADFFVETWSHKLLARIASRLAQLLQNVLTVNVPASIGGIDRGQELWVCDQLADRCTQRAAIARPPDTIPDGQPCNPAILAVADAQETGSLLVRFGPMPGTLLSCLRERKRPFSSR